MKLCSWKTKLKIFHAGRRMFLTIFLSLKQELFIIYTICQEYEAYFLLNTWPLAFVLIMKYTHTCSERVLTAEWTSLSRRDVEICCRNVGWAAWCSSCGHHCSWQRRRGAGIVHWGVCLAPIFIISTEKITHWSWRTTRGADIDLLLASTVNFQSSSSSRSRNRKTFATVA